MSFNKILPTASLLIATFFSVPASAAIESYQFNGIVTGVAPALEGAFNINEILIGRFDVDTAGTQQDTRTIFQASNLVITIGGDYVINGTSGDMIVTNDSVFGDGVMVTFDNSSNTNVFGDLVNGASPGFFDIQLDWFGNGPLSTQALPVFVPVNTGEFDRSNINFPSDSERLSYKLTSMSLVPVPIPAPIWLFGSTLLGLLGIKHRWMKSQ